MKLMKQIATKERVLDRRNRDWSVACVGGERNARMKLCAHEQGITQTPTDPKLAQKYLDELVHARRIAQRMNDLRSDPAELESVRREQFIRNTLGKYEAARLAGDTEKAMSYVKGNPRLVVDAFTFLRNLPHVKGQNGRDLDAAETTALEFALTQLDDAVDYLPADELPDGKPMKARSSGKSQGHPNTFSYPTPPQGVRSAERVSTVPTVPVLSAEGVKDVPVTAPPVQAAIRKPSLAPLSSSLTAPPAAPAPVQQKKRGWRNLLGD